MIKRILVPSDGSDTAKKAARYAFDLAALTHATVTVLTVIDRGDFVGKPNVPADQTPTHIVESLEDFLKGKAEADLDELQSLGRQKEIKTKKVIRFGHAVEEIVKEAETMGSDLIVIGSHGRSAFQAALLGSITFGVIHRDIKVPVLVVRR